MEKGGKSKVYVLNSKLCFSVTTARPKEPGAKAVNNLHVCSLSLLGKAFIHMHEAHRANDETINHIQDVFKMND